MRDMERHHHEFAELLLLVLASLAFALMVSTKSGEITEAYLTHSGYDHTSIQSQRIVDETARRVTAVLGFSTLIIAVAYRRWRKLGLKHIIVFGYTGALIGFGLTHTVVGSYFPPVFSHVLNVPIWIFLGTFLGCFYRHSLDLKEFDETGEVSRRE